MSRICIMARDWATGSMGALISTVRCRTSRSRVRWCDSLSHAEPLFEATLGRIAPHFARAGHVGYVNLNLIVNEQGVWPPEFTCRFGNPGFAVLAALQPDGWGDLLARVAAGGAGRFDTRPGWAVAIVLAVPPFPATLCCRPDDDPPVFFHRPPAGEELARYHFVDMRQEGGQLLAHRRSGHLIIVSGTGASVPAARDAAQARARNVIAPELRWRTSATASWQGRKPDCGGFRGCLGKGLPRWRRMRAIGWDVVRARVPRSGLRAGPIGAPPSRGALMLL